MIRSSIRARLVLLALLPIVPALALSVYTFAGQRHEAVNEAKAEALRLARRAAAEQEGFFTGVRDLLAVVARQLPEARRQPGGCAALVTNLMSPFFVNLAVAAPQGKVVCSAAPLRHPVSLADAPYLERVLRTGEFAVGTYENERVTGQPALPAALPVVGDNGLFQGVVVAWVSQAWLAELAEKVERPAGASVVIADAQGEVVVRHPDPQRLSRALPPAVAQVVQFGRGEGIMQARGPDGSAHLYAMTPVPGVRDAGRPYAIVEIPTAVALAATERGFLLNLLGLGIVGLFLSVGTWFGGSVLILRPVTALVTAARRLSGGDLNARSGLPHTAGELGQLARAFDEMAASIERHLAEQKRAEEALERASRRNELILQSAGEGIFGLDEAGRVAFVNPAAAAMLGWTAEELRGQPLHGLAHHSRPDGRPYPREECPILAALRDGVVRHEDDEVFWRRDGTSVPVEYTSTPIREHGRIVGAVVVIRDISARREAEQERLAKEAAERASQAKSEFLSRTSHELRTPLNAVLGFGQLLEMGPLDPEQRESVEQILRAGRHLLDLINEVLDIARIEAGRLPLSPEPVSVREVVDECVGLIAPLAAGEGIRLEPPADGQDRYVVADRQRLKQVLLNLLSNAVKYNRRQGAVRVAVHGSVAGRVRIEVADTGPGIPPSLVTRLFKPFERLAGDYRTEGTGLGLALSRGLVEAMGGTVGVESAVGRGSTFWLELAGAEPPAHAAAPSPTVASAAAAGGQTVLYIEDNLSNLRLIESLLATRSHVRLLSAMQGRLGIDLALEHRPRLILLDLHLPDLPGEEVLLRLRATPQTRETPVVVISADATAGQADRLVALGAWAYLAKPLDVRRLLALLDEALAAPPGPDGEPPAAGAETSPAGRKEA